MVSQENQSHIIILEKLEPDAATLHLMWLWDKMEEVKKYGIGFLTIPIWRKKPIFQFKEDWLS